MADREGKGGIGRKESIRGGRRGCDLRPAHLTGLGAKGGTGNGKSNGGGNVTAVTAGITLNDADPYLGEWVHFSSPCPSFRLGKPSRSGMCHQSGVLTYGEAGPYHQPFLLGGGSSEWLRNGGTADCQADLCYWSYNGGQGCNGLAATGFVAEG